MDLFEYQAKELFLKHGVPGTQGRVTDTAEGARAIAEEVGKPVMVKAQVKVGGRGKAGGVKYAATPDEAYEHAKNILGLDIKGHIVKKLLVAEASDIAEEYYVSFLLDRANRSYLAMCSVEGGMEIEEVAATKPDRLAKVPVDAVKGVDLAFARSIAEQGHLPAEVLDAAAVTIAKLWDVFVGEDATLVEVNPLVRTPDDRILALDGKVTLDANADFRQPGHAEFEDKEATDPLELKAKEHDLNYVKLSGEVGIIGNGAGLVMSTLDVVAYAGEKHGGVKPANFLDIGGGAGRGDGCRAGRDPGRPRGQERVRQRLRRNHRLRRGGHRHRQGAGDPGRRGQQAVGGPVGRQQRRGGPANPGRGQPPAGDPGRDHGRRCRQSRRAGERLTRRHDPMAIFLNSDNKVIVQGITGGEATTHTARMLKAGTQIVGGVNARKAGTTVSHKDVDGNPVELPVFGTVVEAIEKTGADVSIIFVPPKFAKDAMIEAIDAEIPLLVVITEGIPVQDSAYAWAYNLQKGGGKTPKTRIIGPNCPGIISPGQSLVGITPANITGPGPVGLVSKSGTLTYQMMYELRDFGFTTSIGIGGDPVIGTTHIDAIEAFEKDPDTKLIVMIGEIGGDAEERAADFIKANVTKPVVGYVAGFTAPEGKTMGHAGAIVSGSSGTAAAKKEALEAAGVKVGKTPSETAALAREILQTL